MQTTTERGASIAGRLEERQQHRGRLPRRGSAQRAVGARRILKGLTGHRHAHRIPRSASMDENEQTQPDQQVRRDLPLRNGAEEHTTVAAPADARRHDHADPCRVVEVDRLGNVAVSRRQTQKAFQGHPLVEWSGRSSDQFVLQRDDIRDRTGVETALGLIVARRPSRLICATTSVLPNTPRGRPVSIAPSTKMNTCTVPPAEWAGRRKVIASRSQRSMRD